MRGRAGGQGSCCRHCLSAPAPVAFMAPRHESREAWARRGVPRPCAWVSRPQAAARSFAAPLLPPRSSPLYTLHASLLI